MIFTVALLLIWSASAASAQELIPNGSFESGNPVGTGSFPGWNLVGPADNNSDYGVVASSTAPDVAELGNYYTYFHGHPTDNSQDCLGQTVNLTIGAQYTVSYYLATDGNTLGPNASMYVLIGTAFPIDLIHDILLTAYVPNSAAPLPYQKYTTNITATAATEILAFHGVDATSAILLDNVSVTPAAPPLKVSLSRTNTLIFDWTYPTAGARLQTNTSLTTTNWVSLTNVPIASGISNRLILARPAANVFYRLISP